jgi:hypothetical protein
MAEIWLGQDSRVVWVPFESHEELPRLGFHLEFRAFCMARWIVWGYFGFGILEFRFLRTTDVSSQELGV